MFNTYSVTTHVLCTLDIAFINFPNVFKKYALTGFYHFLLLKMNRT